MKDNYQFPMTAGSSMAPISIAYKPGAGVSEVSHGVD
jgi:hypothetical protein